MPTLPRNDACGLDAVWFSRKTSGAYPCGRLIRVSLNNLLLSSDQVGITVHLDFCGETFQCKASKVGIFDSYTFTNCQTHSYIVRSSNLEFNVDAVQAFADAAWSSSEVLTVKVSSYDGNNTSYSRSVDWQAYLLSFDATDTPAPPTALSRTQNFNDDQACTGTPADWGTVTIAEDGTISLANL